MRTTRLLGFAALLLLMTACRKGSGGTYIEDATTLGGNGNIPANVVGYQYYCTSDIPGLNITETKVLSNNNGEVTINIQAVLPNHPLTSLVPPSLVGSNGTVNFIQKYKNTDEGILDYTNGDGKPFVIVKYDGSVGDQYRLRRNNGSVITRTIMSKSINDDYAYGPMMIKVMKIDQNFDEFSNMQGFRKVTYIANHRWGLVGLVFESEDGSNYKIKIAPQPY